MTALAAAAKAHLIHDPWPGTNVLAFMAARIEDDPRRLTVACQVDTGAPLLCGGRVPLIVEHRPGLMMLWPAAGCTNGHPLADVEHAYGLMADTLGRDPPAATDPIADYELSVARHALAEGVAPAVVRRILTRAAADVRQ